MSYIVRWLKDEIVVEERRFEDLQEAKQGAKNQLSSYRARGDATHAVVSDDEGVVYFRMF